MQSLVEMQLLLDTSICALARDDSMHSCLARKINGNATSTPNKSQRQTSRRTRIEGRSQWSSVNAIGFISLAHWLGSMHLAGDVLRAPCILVLPTRCCRQARLFGITYFPALWVSSPMLRYVARLFNHHRLVERSLQRLLRWRFGGPRRRLELPHLSRLLTDIVDLLLGSSVNENSRCLSS